ncbi:MAG: molecular chaperone TorD family protein [Bacteroidales bacterium]
MVKYDGTNDDILKAYSMLLYFSGSFILDQPQESCIYDLASSNIFKKMPVESSNPNFILASSYLNRIDRNAIIDYEAILNDHLKLFGGLGSPKAPPYESVYLSEEHLVFQQQTLEVRKIYESYGWRSSLNGKVPDDHLGIELQFLNLLLEKYHEIDDTICHKELATDINKFIDLHLSKWIFEWNKNLQEHARSDFYKGIGYLVIACVQDIKSIV